MTAVVEALGTRRMPSALNYSPADVGMVVERERVFITPTGASEFMLDGTQTKFVQFDLPRDGYLDSNTFTMEFDLTVANLPGFGAGGGYPRVVGPIAAEQAAIDLPAVRLFSSAYDVINRFRLLQGSTELMDMENYNMWKALEYLWMVPESYQREVGYANEGVAPMSYALGLAQTENSSIFMTPAAAGTVTKRFQLNISDGIFGTYHFLPMGRQQQWQIKANIESKFRALLFSSSLTANQIAAITASISNVRLYFDRVTLPDEIDAGVVAAINDSALKLHFSAIRSQTQIMTGQNATVKFTERVTSLKSVFIVANDNANQQDPYDVQIGKYNGMDWYAHQFRINGIQYPPYKVENKVEAYHWATRACGFFRVPWVPGKPLTSLTTDINGMNESLIHSSLDTESLLHEPYRSVFSTEQYTAAAGTYPFTLYATVFGWPATLDVAGNVATSRWTFPRPTIALSKRNKFMIAYDFDREEDPHAITGLNTANKQADIEVQIERLAQADQLLTGFVMFDATLIIAPMGRASVAR